jgi:hypothetical protein
LGERPTGFGPAPGPEARLRHQNRSEIPDNQVIEFVWIVAAPALGWAMVDFRIVFPLRFNLDLD